MSALYLSIEQVFDDSDYFVVRKSTAPQLPPTVIVVRANSLDEVAREMLGLLDVSDEVHHRHARKRGN